MKLANLTFARFAAALLVYLCHFGDPEKLSACCGRNFAILIQNGYSGVTFFFILSGFVLAFVYLDSFAKLSVGGIAEFYFFRAARILPLWFFLSLPFILGAVRSHQVAHLLPYITFTQAWSRDSQIAFGYIGVAWTLSVEMFFYLLFPLVAYGICLLKA